MYYCMSAGLLGQRTIVIHVKRPDTTRGKILFKYDNNYYFILKLFLSQLCLFVYIFKFVILKMYNII